MVSKKGVTCLHLACGSGKLEMARFLIEVQQFSPEVVTIVSGSKPIHMAAKSGDIEIMKYLINKRNCNPQDVDNNQEDCLTLAIKEKQTEMSNYLVGLKRFNLGQVKERSGFNYFSYAIVKG